MKQTTTRSKQKVGTVYLISFTAKNQKVTHTLRCEAWLDYAENISKIEDVIQIELALKDQFKGYSAFNIVSFTTLRKVGINGEQKIYIRKV